MIELIRHIPGPVFLLYFFIFSGLCIILGWRFANADNSLIHPMPHIKNFDPAVVDVLTGKRPSSVEHIPQFERVYKLLQQHHLIRNRQDHERAWTISIIVSLLICLPGGLKLTLGIIYQRPFGFLVFSIGMYILLTFRIIRPWQPATVLGRRFLIDLKKQYPTEVHIKNIVHQNITTVFILLCAAVVYFVSVYLGIMWSVIAALVGFVLFLIYKWSSGAYLGYGSGSSYGCGWGGGCSGCGGGCGGCGGCGGE